MMSFGSDMVFSATGDINIDNTNRGLDFLENRIADDAFYSSPELYDALECHPHTRVAVLDDIMKWVIESEAGEDFMLWFFGPAGSGKSTIAKRIAELAAEKDLLIGTFLFSRTSPTRNTEDRLIPTLAYQLALSIPDTRIHIEDAIERDPVIFRKNMKTQIDTLLIEPFQSALTQTISSQKLVIIDGLDECRDSQTQVAILDAISESFTFTQHKLPIIFLVVSRPEVNIVTSFNHKEPLRSIHHRLVLDDTYCPDDDIRLFFSDKFEDIRRTHRLRLTIPNPWPTEEVLETLVHKSSGQFIFAVTVVRFVESNHHRPPERLEVILGISPPGIMNPFAGLDGMYKHMLSSVDNIPLTLRVLSLYTAAPPLVDYFGEESSMSAENFLFLEDGDIDLALTNLPSIVSYDKTSGKVKILHAPLVDFLSDKHRSNEFYIDMAFTCTDFASRTLQCVRGPDGIAAGDLSLFRSGLWFPGWILTSQLKSDILNFDFDAFISAMIENRRDVIESNVISAFHVWIDILKKEDLQEALSQCLNSFESWLQKYQSEMTSSWIAAEHALHHIQQNWSQIEAVFAAHDIQKSEYVLYAGFDESLIRAEVGYLEQIHVFSSASVVVTSLLSQLGKIFSPFSSLLFTESSIHELPVYKPDGTTWIFDELVFQTAFKLIDQGSTATTIPTVISTCTCSCPSTSEPPKKSGSNDQEKGENKKGKEKAGDDEIGDRDNEDNKEDNSSEDSDSDDPDGKKPENPIRQPTVLFDVVSQMIVNQNGLEKLFQKLGVQGQIMIKAKHYPSHPNFDIKFVELNFNTKRTTVNTGYQQIHLRVTIDPQEQTEQYAKANVIQPRQTSASNREIKGVSGSKTSWAQTSSVAASLRLAPQATATFGSSRTTETSGTTETTRFTSQITEQTLGGVVCWGFQIDDESDRKGGVKILGSKLPHALFDFYPKSGSINPSIASLVDVEVASYWSLISPAKQGLKWLTDFFTHSQVNGVVFSNICQVVALKIPSTLMKHSSYNATLKVNIANPDLPREITVGVKDGEIGLLVDISGAHDFTPAGHGDSLDFGKANAF